MTNDDPIPVKDAVYKLQHSLLDGIRDENQLFAAGSLMSRSDYEDVVKERSLAKVCGYPLCNNTLPSERPRKGRYRVSLKEHKVYDLQETYMYCCSSCVVNSRAFAASLQEERCSVFDPAKIDRILKLFGDLSLESQDGLGKDGDLGLSELKIQEKSQSKAGEVPLEEWIGPSNAIEGYVPKDRNSKPLLLKQRKGDTGKNLVFNDMDFTSEIFIGDEYSIAKTSTNSTKISSNKKSEESKSKIIPNDNEHQFTILEMQATSVQNKGEGKLKESSCGKSELSIPEVPTIPCQNGSDIIATEGKKDPRTEKEAQIGDSMLKSSMKSSGAKKLTRSVTWADKKADSMNNTNLCAIRELEDTKEDSESLGSMEIGDDDNALRFASAEACALALSQAAEAVGSGQSGVTDAVAEAGIVIVPRPHDEDEGDSLEEDVDMLGLGPAPIKWPTKPVTDYDFFESQNSWYDTPPEGFNLTLSPFATMWMALFAWVTSSSLAYIYGRDESFHEEYLSVNGREYPQKIVLTDGRSSEIKQALAGCLARALPGLVAELGLPTPLSILERGMGHLLETMSFFDALPSFRTRQWQVIALLFMDALSICRIPGLTPHMTSRRTSLHKVLEGAQVGVDEYEVMKDFIIPLGRAPQFSAQRGG